MPGVNGGNVIMIFRQTVIYCHGLHNNPHCKTCLSSLIQMGYLVTLIGKLIQARPRSLPIWLML